MGQPTPTERRFRRASLVALATATFLIVLAIASVFATLTGRWVTPSTPGPFGESGWRDRKIVVDGGAISFASTGFLGTRGDTSGKPPYVFETGLRVRARTTDGIAWTPTLILSGGIWWRLPIWIVAGPLLLAGIACRVRANRLRVERTAGLCRACGYDLRATPLGCPECGTHSAVDA